MVTTLCFAIVVAVLAIAYGIVVTRKASLNETRVEGLATSIKQFMRWGFGTIVLQELTNVVAQDHCGLTIDSGFSSSFTVFPGRKNPLRPSRWVACYDICVKRSGDIVASMKFAWDTAREKSIVCSCCNDPLEFPFSSFGEALAHVIAQVKSDIESHAIPR